MVDSFRSQSPPWVLFAAGAVRAGVRAVVVLTLAASASGCLHPQQGVVDAVWGKQGERPGQLQKPRAAAIDESDQLYIVDMTGRIQVFDCDGEFLRGWRTPATAQGKPSGLSFDNDGNLLVADTHYFRMLVYTPEGELLQQRSIGGVCGPEHGNFHFVTDAVQDSQGCYYIGEYGENDRIQKFSPTGEFLMQIGSHGQEPLQFVRPQNIAIDANDHLWVADACNHRIQVIDATGEQPKLVRIWGQEGEGPGELRYPYDLVLDGEGHVYVCEFGNHRVQKFTLEGELVGSWGGPGREPGQLCQPWALVRDSRGRTHVVDTYNHRVQRVYF